MSEHALTRRGFLASAAAVGALAATSGLTGCASVPPAAPVEARAVHTYCGGRYSTCGLTAYVTDGKLGKLIGDGSNPNSTGKLDAVAYGYPQTAYAKNRIASPLKASGNGSFSPISWNDAYAEIADKIASITGESGGQAIACVYGANPTAAWYAPRLMGALGSANVYDFDEACNLSTISGCTQVVGGTWTSDIDHCEAVMVLGAGYEDETLPGRIAQLSAARERGASVIMVGARMGAEARLASQWVFARPGTELALLLAMSNVLVRNGRYDQAFVASQVEGFEQWVSYVSTCTPDWAEDVCGVDSATIEMLANTLANAAPAASVELPMLSTFAWNRSNSGETARAAAAFNALLGCYNQAGGACLFGEPSLQPADAKLFPAAKRAGAAYGSDEYPLAAGGSLAALFDGMQKRAVKGLIVYGANPVGVAQNPAALAKCAENLELLVVIDVQMSETAQIADYVLPDCSYLERFDLPAVIPGANPAVCSREQVLDPQVADARPCGDIFSQLAEACGKGDLFPYGIRELAQAQLDSVGLSLEALSIAGTASVPGTALEFGKLPARWNTPSGKIQLASKQCVAAGLPAVPEWVPPTAAASDGKFVLVAGKQAVQRFTDTLGAAPLMDIAKEYGLERAWISAADALKLGVKDGDQVEISNGQHTGRVAAKVTKRIAPGCVYLPDHYGSTVRDLQDASGMGLRPVGFAEFAVEPGYGGTCAGEAVVTVRKVGE